MTKTFPEMLDKLKQLQAMTPDGVSGILDLEMLSYDPVNSSCLFRAKTQPWMKNPAGTLHGGLSATILDHAMGALMFCLKEEEGFCPTVEMQTSYHRPLIPGKDVLVRARVVSKTKRFIHMAAEAAQDSAPEKTCISGTAIYYLTE